MAPSVKKALFTLCTIMMTYATLEAAAFAGHYVLYGRPFLFEEIQPKAQQAYPENRQAAPDQQKNAIHQAYALHPYLGFVHNIDYPSYWNKDATAYGLLGERDPFIASTELDVAIVALSGGSVMERFFRDSRHVLRPYLEALPVFQGKKIVIVMLGASGWHQPQSLLSVGYYLSQGGRLDMLINLDGKNEATVGYYHKKQGMHPAFPHFYDAFFPKQVSAEATSLLGRIAFWEHLRVKAADTVQSVRYSIAASLLWKIADDYFERQKTQTEIQLHEAWRKDLPGFTQTPSVTQDLSDDGIFDNSARLWAQSSMRMQHLAKTNGFYYFHFLQPNQYVPDSKPLSKHERARAYEESVHALTIRAMYPRFEARFPELRAQGLAMYNLAYLFRDTKETLYVDVCCHVNKRGSNLIGHAMGKHIREYFAVHPHVPEAMR